ncbi:hypothetical protein DFH09DRAFT_1322098 [Mycena vulgaris]|nr:hypothetical protein DFH09DRAFT_1322098 [Mycena vulgaris]
MDSSEITPINAVTAASERLMALKLLTTYKRHNREKKAKVDKDDPGYKARLEARIAECDVFMAGSTINPNAPTLDGSPADQIVAGGGGQPGNSDAAGDKGPSNAAASPGSVEDPPIDPALSSSEAPPPKKARGNDGQPRHRKIITVSPMDSVMDSITAPMLARFVKGWLTSETRVQAADPASPADGFSDLREAAADIFDMVLEVVERSKFAYEQLGWKIDYEGGPMQISHLTALHDWLVTAELMVGNIQKKPVLPPKKVANDEPVVKIIHDGKRVIMTRSMAIDARLTPSMYPGCVENGMTPVISVLTNRAGKEKCITCDGVRGQALTSKPAPPKKDGSYLTDCKCPVRGAALELWMIKMTADNDDIPQRANDVTNHRLALNPDILKVIAGAIEVASGHQIETLLTPERDRLLHTIHWALARLHSIADDEDSVFANSFVLLSDKLRDTMKAIDAED